MGETDMLKVMQLIVTPIFRCRCVHITDIGIGYISTMLALHTLYLRWCTQIRDFGLQHICGMRSMQILSLAGKFVMAEQREGGLGEGVHFFDSAE